jgi:hypothetical protein
MKRIRTLAVSASIAALLLIGVATPPVIAAQAMAAQSTKRLTIEGPTSATVGHRVKVRMFVPSKSAALDWGDGTIEPVRVTTMTLCMGSKAACDDSARTFTARHVYQGTGSYTVTLTSPKSMPKKASLTIKIS